MKIKSFTFNPFQENTYILFDDTLECIIVDPGCYEQKEEIALSRFIAESGLKPVRLINTHAHIDHVFGNKFIAEKYQLELELHVLDVPILELASLSAMNYSLKYETSPEPTKLINEGDEVKFGNSSLMAIHVPGHAPGHLVFYDEKGKNLIGGDVLFKGSIGRTDLPGGNHDDLITNIKSKLFILPEEVVVHPGHGPTTSIGYEKKHNPFFRD